MLTFPVLIMGKRIWDYLIEVVCSMKFPKIANKENTIIKFLVFPLLLENHQPALRQTN